MKLKSEQAPSLEAPNLKAPSLGARLLDSFLAGQTISARAWGQACGIEASYLCHLRKGRRTPSMSVAARIDKATCGAVAVESWTR